LAFFVAAVFPRMPVIETVVSVPALQLQPQHKILCWRKKITLYFFIQIQLLIFAI
jgi:hypothetical protein